MNAYRLARKHRRRGSALLMSLVAVVSVSILAAGLLQVASATMRRSQATLDNRRAFYLAEAGLAEAYVGLAEGFSGNVGTQARPARYGDGLFWVESTFEPSGHVVLEATGMCGSGRATLSMVAEPVVTSVTGLGFFAGEDIRVEPRTLIDGYDSSLGTYESQADMTAVPPHTPGGAIFGSNGDLDIAGGKSGSFIYGDAQPGPSGSLTTAGTVTITGSTSPRAQMETLPPVDVPVLPKLPPRVYNAAAPLVIPPSEVAFTSLQMTSGTTLLIQGPATVVFEDFLMDSGCELIVDPTKGRVDIYVENSIELSSGALVNCTSTNPALLTMMIAANVAASGPDNVKLNASGQFHGTLYAPQSNVKISNGFEVFGAAVGQKLTLSSSGRLHVDAELMNNSSTSIPRMVSWRVVDIPRNVATRRVDPFVALNVDPTTLPLVRDAHADVWLDIRYKDTLLVDRSYTGWSSVFDWNTVSSLSSFKSYTDDPLAVDSVPIQEKSSNILSL